MKTRSGTDKQYEVVKYSERLMIRYRYNDRYKYFYRSTGENSTMPGTWFPCDGVQRKNYTSKYGCRKKGWIKKPHGSRLWLYFSYKGIYSPEIERFGTLEDMAVSASMGGSFWKGEASLVLKEHLDFENVNVHVSFLKKALEEEKTLTNINVNDVLKIF